MIPTYRQMAAHTIKSILLRGNLPLNGPINDRMSPISARQMATMSPYPTELLSFIKTDVADNTTMATTTKLYMGRGDFI